MITQGLPSAEDLDAVAEEQRIAAMTAAQPKQCEWITTAPVYAKSIGGIPIDHSEWANEHGALLWDLEVRCRYVADPAKKYCPRHEMVAAMQKEAA